VFQFEIEAAITPRAIAPPGQEGWLRDQVNIAKPPYLAQTGWLIQ
jgi:hypothetical protein